MINCGSCKGKHATVSQVRGCYGQGVVEELDARREARESSGRSDALPRVNRGQERHDPTGPSAEQAPAQPREVPNGTYTVVMADGRYRTLRLRDDFRDDGPEGAQVVEFLSGPDNELDFTGCAFLEGARLRVWKRFRTGFQQDLEEIVRVLLEGDEGEARETYALRSGRCSACGRKLTVPASLHRGMGPDCAEKWGLL